MKAAIVILVIVCVGLTAALLFQHNQAVQSQNDDTEALSELSNRLSMVQGNFEELEQVNMWLNKSLTSATNELANFSNKLMTVSRNLEETEAEAKKAAEVAQVELDKRESRISELTVQGDGLNDQIGQLNLSIGNMNQLIAETERKLAASEGDRDFLLTELKRLQGEKSNLERQFNDLALLRTQVSKLKDELSVAKRLEWIRRGIYGREVKKGAQILMQGITAPTERTNFNLNVELKQDGTATVVSPSTNSPPKQ